MLQLLGFRYGLPTPMITGHLFPLPQALMWGGGETFPYPCCLITHVQWEQFSFVQYFGADSPTPQPSGLTLFLYLIFYILLDQESSWPAVWSFAADGRQGQISFSCDFIVSSFADSYIYGQGHLSLAYAAIKQIRIGIALPCSHLLGWLTHTCTNRVDSILLLW